VTTVIMQDCLAFRTRTQNGWSNAAGGEGSLVHSLLSAPFGNLVAGVKGDINQSLTVRPDAAACIGSRLPASGTAAALPANYGNKNLRADTCNSNSPALGLTSNGKFDNPLLGQTVALMLNLRLDRQTGNNSLGSLQLCPVMTTINSNGVVKTYTIPAAVLAALGDNRSVNNLRNLANRGLSGQSVTPATLNSINTALSRVNGMFSGNGQVALLSTSCTSGLPGRAMPVYAGGQGDDERYPGSLSRESAAPARFGEPAYQDGRVFTNHGGAPLAPALSNGLLEIDSDYVQKPLASLLIELRGRESEAAASHDVLEVTGMAFLNGTLIVTLAEGYVPEVGDCFEIITAQAIVGQFQLLEVTELESGRHLAVKYSPTSVIIEVQAAAHRRADLDGNGVVDRHDLLMLLQQWDRAGSADLNGDGRVDAADLLLLLGQWGG
jgi:hypothetical protein